MSHTSRRTLAKLVRAVAVPYSQKDLELLYAFRLHIERLEERYLLSNNPPAIADLRLLHDTGTPGDNITSDITITGRVTNDGSASALPVEFDVNWDGAADGTVYSSADSAATFIIDLSNNVFAPGPVSVRVRAAEMGDDGFTLAYGAWSTLSFTYATSSASGDEHQHTFPASVSNATFGSETRMDQGASAPTAVGPANFNGGSNQLQWFDTFGSRFSDHGNSSWSDGGTDSQDYYTSDSTGTYHYVTSYTYSKNFYSYSDYYSWNFNENFSETYSSITEFSGYDGTTWWRSQNSSHNTSIYANGSPSSSTYYASEGWNESYSFSWSEPYTANHSKGYGGSGHQQSSFSAYGGSSSDEYGGYTNDDISYDAYGSDSYSDGGSDSTGSGANYSYSGSGNSGQSSWHYSSRSLAGTGPGSSNESFTFAYDRDAVDGWSQSTSSKSDKTTNSGGISNHTVGQATSSLSGTKTTHLHLDGWRDSSGGSSSLFVNRNYNESTHDNYNTTSSSTSDIADGSVAKVTVNSHLTSSSASNRTRDLLQSYNGTTSVNNGVLTYSDYTSGSNTLKGDWTASNSSHVTGTDTTVSGTTRTMISDRSAGDSGTSNYSFTSSGTESRDAAGAITKTGTSNASSNLTGKTNFNSSDSSTVNSTTTITSGGASKTTTIVGSDSATNAGSGTYTANATGQASFNPNGSIATSGTSSHSASVSGTTSEAHNYTTAVTESGSPSPGMTRNGTSTSTLQSNENTTFSTSASGSGTFGNGKSTTSESESRNENGTSDSMSTQEDDVTETDNRPGVPHTTTHVTSWTENYAYGTTSFSTSITQGDNNGAKTYSNSQTESATGSTYTYTASDSTIDVTDNTNPGIATTGHSTSHSEQNIYGDYSESLTQTSKLEAGGYSSTRAHSLSDSGSYDGIQSSNSNSHSVDNSTAGTTVDFTSASDSTGNTYGTYSKSDSQNESTSAAGSYKSSSIVAHSTDDGGDSVSHSSSVTTVNGVESSPGVSTTFNSTSNTTSTDTGSFTASTSHNSSTTIENGNTLIATSDTNDRDEEGTTTWSSTSNGSNSTTDTSTPGISISSGGSGGSNENGTGSYSIIDHSDITSITGIGTTSNITHSHSTSGTSNYSNNSSGNSSTSDTSTPHITRSSFTSSNSGGNGTGSYSTLETSESHVHLINSNSSSFSSRDTSHTGYSYFSMFSGASEVQDIPADGISSTQTSTQATLNSTLNRSGNGNTSGSTHFETSTINGSFVHSLNTSDETENGTLYEYQTQNSDSTTTQDVYDNGDWVSESSDHHTQNSTAWTNGFTHFNTTSVAESFGDGTSYSFNSSSYNGSGTGHTDGSSASDGYHVTVDSSGGVTDVEVSSSSSGSTDWGYSDGSYDESESLRDGSWTTESWVSRGEGGKLSRTGSSTNTGTADSSAGGTHHSQTTMTRSESSNGTWGNSHYQKTTSASGGSSTYYSSDSSNEQGKFTWSDSQETHGTFDSNSDGKRHSSNDFTSSENGSGTYSSSYSSTNNNGKVHTKSSDQTATTSTFQSSDSTSGTFHKTFTAPDKSVQQLDASSSDSSIVSGGAASNSSSHSREDFEDGTWVEITGSSNSESANITTSSSSSNSAFVNYPVGAYDGTKTASSSSSTVIDGSGNYSSTDTSTKTETQSGWTSTDTNIHSENDNETWDSSTTSSSVIEKDSASGTHYNATSHDNSTDTGSGSNSYSYNWTTNASNTTSTTTGNSHRSMSVSGNNTWDRGTDTSSSGVTPYAWGNCTRTSTSSSHSHDKGDGDYSVSGGVDITKAGGVTTYSGGITRTTHGTGDTADTKTRSWTDECSSENSSSTSTDSITAGDLGDYKNSSDSQLTFNADGTTVTTSTNTHNERHWAYREHAWNYDSSETYTDIYNIVHDVERTRSTKDTTKAGRNYNSETGLTDRDYFYTYSTFDGVVDTTDHVTETWTDKTDHSESRTRSDDEKSGSYTKFSATVDDSSDSTHTKTWSYDYGSSQSSGSDNDHVATSSHRSEDYDGAGGSIDYSRTRLEEHTHHDESSSYGSYGSSSSSYHDSTSSQDESWDTSATVNQDRTADITAYSYSDHEEYHDHWHSQSNNCHPNGPYGYGVSCTSSHSDSWRDHTIDASDEMVDDYTRHYHWEGSGTDCYDNDTSNGKQCDPWTPDPVDNDNYYDAHHAESLWYIGGYWYETLVEQISDFNLWADGIVDAMYADLQGLITVLLNPADYVDNLVAQLYQYWVDGTIADGFFGAVDGAASVIPFHDYFIPTIGAKYGHQDAYQIGSYVGMAVGVAASVLIGNVAAGGLVGCGTFLQKAAQVYNVLDNASGIISASQHIMNGTAGWGDALAFLPVVSFGASKMAGLGGCFVAGTLVVVDDEVVPAATGVSIKEEDAEKRRVRWTLLGAAAGACFVGVLGYRRIRRKYLNQEADPRKRSARPVRLRPALEDPDVLLGEPELSRVPWHATERASPQRSSALFCTAPSKRVASLFQEVSCDNN